jgi:hypothetical protein
MKISGHKHTFEAQNAAERDGWFMAVEKAITEAKAAKDGIESSEGYKESKESIGKPTALAAATSSAPKKSTDATPKLAETDATAAGEPVAAPARAGSSSSSSGEEKAAKKAKKNKSRSVSRNKRASMFGGLLGKKDKEQKQDVEAVKTEPEVQKEESAAAPHLDEIPHPAPVNTNDVVNAGEEAKAEPVVPVAAAPAEEAAKVEETPAVHDKPKPVKRSSIFGSFAQKLKSPTTEKKEHEAGLAIKENEPVTEDKPLEEAQVSVPDITEPAQSTVTEPAKTEEKISTPSKERGHFSFGKVFGGKDRAKSPAATEKLPEPKADAAPKVEDGSAPAVSEPVSTEATPVVAESKTEVEGETPKPAKRASFFGNLTRSLSKAAGGKTQQKEKKDVTSPAPVAEEEPATSAPSVEEKKDETPATVGDVPAEAVSVGEAPKSSTTNPTVATTA